MSLLTEPGAGNSRTGSFNRITRRNQMPKKSSNRKPEQKSVNPEILQLVSSESRANLGYQRIRLSNESQVVLN